MRLIKLDSCHIVANEVKARNTTNIILHKIYVTLWGRGHLVSSSKTVIPNPNPWCTDSRLHCGDMVSSLDYDSFCSIPQPSLILVLHYINNMKSILWGHGLWSLTVCVLFLRLCYSGITFYQQREKNLGR